MQTQQIEVGDTVQLTASILFGLHDQNRAAYDSLMAGKRTGGKVIELSDSHITVDIGQDQPIILEVDNAGRDIALQLVQKGEGNHGSETATMVKAVEPQPGPPAESQPNTMMGFPFEGLPIMQVIRGGMPGIFQSPQQSDEPAVPQTVRLSQWVIIQFIGLKQYGIVQDLNRTSDATAPGPDPTGESWKNKELRAVQIELAAPEEGLYNAALGAIKDWIIGPKPKSTHPELTTVAAEVVVELSVPDGPDAEHLGEPGEPNDA